MKEMNLRERLHELRSGFLNEIEKGNFTLSNVSINFHGIEAIIEVNGLKMSIQHINSTNSFFTHSFGEYSLIPSSIDTPKKLLEKLKELTSDSRIEKIEELKKQIIELEKLES